MNNIDIKEFVNKISNTFSTKIVEKKYNIYIDNSGISLFLFFHALLTNKVTKYDNAFKMLEQTIMRYRQSKVTPPSVAKMGWLLINLDKNGFVESDVNELIGNVDEFLFKIIPEYINKGHYDFLHGAMGIVLYFLSKNEKETDEFISQFIDEFEKTAGNTEGSGLKWLSTIDYKTGKKGYNISMSHGIASIIAMLSKIYKNGINRQKTKYLLEGAMNYLLQQKLPEGKYISIFPNLALESMDTLYPSRLAWCYGDLGIPTLERICNPCRRKPKSSITRF